jgi:hypothetical protein
MRCVLFAAYFHRCCAHGEGLRSCADGGRLRVAARAWVAREGEVAAKLFAGGERKLQV